MSTAVGIDRIGFSPHTTIESDILRWCGLKQMQLTISLFYRAGDFTMDGCYPLDRMKDATELLCQGQDSFAITTNNALLRGVDDQQVDTLLAVDCLMYD